MRLADGDGKLLAYFTIIDTELGITFRDFRLLNGSNGVFVTSPYRSYDKDGETKYVQFVEPAYDEQEEARSEAGTAYFDEMAQVAYARYEELAEEDERTARSSSRKTTKASKPVAKKSGFGSGALLLGS
jgi:DNA-binding cell septation regulator SpoVG